MLADQEVTVSIQDEKGMVVRTLNGRGSAGIYRVNWDLKRLNKVSDADAALAGVTTNSERESLDWGRQVLTLLLAQLAQLRCERRRSSKSD